MPYDANGQYISDMEFYILAQQEAQRQRIEKQKQAQAVAQQQQLQQSIGTVGGVTAGNMVSNAITPAAAAAPAASAGTGAVATPQILGASRVPAGAQFGLGNAAAGVGGAALLADVLGNKKYGGAGALEGAMGGAGLGYAAAPLLASTGIGLPAALALGAAGGGALGYMGNFGDVNKFQTESKRAQALKEKGVQWDFNQETPSKGRSKEELTNQSLPKDFIGFDDQGNWVNNKFANDRNESGSKGEDWVGYSAWGEKLGNDWMQKLNHDQRVAIANKAVERNAIDEHHGTMDVREDAELNKYIEDVKSGAVKVSSAAQPTPGQPMNLSQNIMSAPVEPQINKKAMALSFMDKIGNVSPNVPKPTVGIPKPGAGKTFDEILQSAMGG
jgi:hypothetical protein